MRWVQQAIGLSILRLLAMPLLMLVLLNEQGPAAVDLDRQAHAGAIHALVACSDHKPHVAHVACCGPHCLARIGSSPSEPVPNNSPADLLPETGRFGKGVAYAPIPPPPKYK